ncbi:MAG: ribosome maturation factor RimP [Oscillospiraceae bacterium]|nr:ribosome maturation factor RimP [Oscillospiraceae bacterium]
MRIVDEVEKIAGPVAAEHGCELWDVEYVKEGSERYLRVYIDKEGGVSIQDCEAISVVLDPMLDELDVIQDSYIFEVSSAGAERRLKKPRDFERCIGRDVLVKLYSAVDGRKEYPGKLLSYTDGDIDVSVGDTVRHFEKKEYSSVRLRIDF